MKIVTVIPLAKGIFKENLTYFSAQNILDGSIVSISVRNKKILGIAVSSEEVSSAKSNIKEMSFNLKKILEVKKKTIFSTEFLKAGIEMSEYSAVQTGMGLTALLPASFREGYDKISPLPSPPPRGGQQVESLKNLKLEKKLFQASFIDRISFYKTFIRGSFAEKKSVFMLLPTEYDIEIFSEMLSKGIENFTFCVHGGFSPKKQIEKFRQISVSEHPVLVLGTGPFLSVPRNDFGAILVEHESSNAYKMIGRPYFDFRIFAELLASKIKAKFILGDTLLRFETIGRKEIESLSEVHPLSYRIDFGGEIKIENPNHLEALPLSRGKASFKIFSEKTIKEIQDMVSKKQNVFIFSLRKGLATMTVCRDCGETINCEKCLAPVTLYLSKDRKKRRFICNRCAVEKNPETVCGKCGSWNLVPLGIGVDTVFEELKKILPKNKIFKLDKENAKTATEAEKIIQEYENNSGSILIGTELAFFYLKNKISLSIVASFDSLWSVPNFKIKEKVIQLIISIISKTEKKLIIQTKNEQDSALLAIQRENLLSFVREELADRKNLGYPPYKIFIKITHLGDKEETIRAKKYLKEILEKYQPDIFSGFVSKFKNKYITNALIKLEPKNWSLPGGGNASVLNSNLDQNLLEKLLSLPPTFSVNVNPEDLL